MNFASRLSQYAAIFLRRPIQIIAKPSLHFLPPTTRSSHATSVTLFYGLRRQCYSSGSADTKALKRKARTAMPKEKTEETSFFVLRKGDVIGVYKDFNDCLAQAGTSICDPAVSVFRGNSLSVEAEAYLSSQGLRNALYTIRASDLRDDLFGPLTPCPIVQPCSTEVDLQIGKKRSRQEPLGPNSTDSDLLLKQPKAASQASSQKSDSDRSCIIEFDGASRGNPGLAGAGAVLRATDGSVICRLREGLGVATNNVAEYRAILLGLKYALENGYRDISVLGDSKLVCLQIQGIWKVKHENLKMLCEEARKLMDKFSSFKIDHVLREFNSDADAQANLAVNLPDGQVEEDFD